MANRTRWGILGLGNIAKQFARGLTAVSDGDLVACGSRTQPNADRFGDEFEVPSRHASYEALANDPEVDAIYVSTPHSLHKENCILCLEAGKAVLCEKPFTINRAEADEVIAVARREKVFLMEAMWTRFVPIMYKVRTWLGEGAIGDVTMVTADFGFGAKPNSESRLWKPELGGGALMDVGVYAVSFASMIQGCQPNRIASLGHIGNMDVDDNLGMVFGYEGGALAMLYTSIRSRTPQHAYILGTEGTIHVHSPFWRATTATLTRGGEDETVEMPFEGNGYNCEAEEVMRCMENGTLESEIMPHDESLAIMQTLDDVRGQLGLKYPME